MLTKVTPNLAWSTQVHIFSRLIRNPYFFLAKMYKFIIYLTVFSKEKLQIIINIIL